MTNFTWTVERLESTNLENFENYVVTVSAKLIAEKDGFKVENFEFTSFPITQTEGLKPFAELTNDEVIGWLVASLPKQRVERMQKMLERQLDSMIEEAAQPPKPVVKSVDLPWAK
jgi:hypothetical protein